MAKRFQTLNIGAANVQLAEYEVGAKGALTLVNYGTAALGASLDGGDAATILAPALLAIVREKGIRPGSVVMSVAGQMVFPKFAAIPMAGGEEKFEQLVRYEVEQNIPFPIDEMVCDRQVLGDTESGDKAVMIVAAKIDQIESLVAAVQSAGFSPEIVDAAPLAVTNVLRHNAGSDESCAIVLDIGAKTTSLVISEGDKVYNRSIPIAGNTLTKEIAQALGCSIEDAERVKCEKAYVSLGGVTEDEDPEADRIAKVCRAVMTRINAEISRSINFYRSQQHGSAPVRLYLTGGSALLPQLDEFFASALQIEVAFFNPFEQIGVGAKVDATALDTDAAVLAATAGLALHATGAARFAISLLPPSLVAARAERAKIPFLVGGGVALVAALVLLTMGVNNARAVIEAERDGVQTVVDKLTSSDKKVTAASQKLESTRAEAETFRKLLASRAVAVQRVNAVRSSLGSGMWVDRWENGKLVIRRWNYPAYVATGKNAGDALKESLKKKAVIDPASVNLTSKSSIGKDQAEQFTVELKFK